jgi:acetyl esterase/lipase
MWIHGGGYMTGMKEMAYVGRAADLVREHGAVVVAPGYHLSLFHPYPVALNDCYATLLYIRDHAAELGIRPDQIMVGGESAGGGLAAAIAMLARDRGEVQIAFQMPLYPMIDNFDTDSSRDNHAKVWNTKRNHQAWAVYLRKDARKDVSPYAAPARQTDYAGLPPAYTFVCTAEPFYCETLQFIDSLKAAGVEARVDVYDGMYHAFDMSEPDHPVSREAIRRFNEMFAYAKEHYFAPQKE